MSVWQHYCLGKLHQHISAKPTLGAAEFSLLHTSLCLVSSPTHMHPLSACNCGSSLQNKPSCRFVLNTAAPHRPRGHWFIKQTAQECSGSFSTQANQGQWGESFYTYSFFWSLHTSHASFLGSLRQRGSAWTLPEAANRIKPRSMKKPPLGTRSPSLCVTWWEAALGQLCPAVCSQRRCCRRCPGVAGSICSKLQIVL